MQRRFPAGGGGVAMAIVSDICDHSAEPDRGRCLSRDTTEGAATPTSVVDMDLWPREEQWSAPTRGRGRDKGGTVMKGGSW